VAKESRQKFIARNRSPRVQIEYDVEVYGSEKKVQIPFVMGVMADLTGKGDPADEVPDAHQTARGGIASRKFLEVDVDNFEDRMKALKPRVSFRVPNTLTGEGELPVDLTFESMDDFSPAAIARKVDSLNQLLTARTQLDNLLTFMDGKAGAEELMNKVIQDNTLLQSLAAGAANEGGAADGGGEGDGGGEEASE
jgi:type VI secretion system protein ImpB